MIEEKIAGLLPECITNSKLFLTVVTDLEGRYMYVNDLFKKRFNFLNKHFFGQYFKDTLHKDDIEKAIKAAYSCITEPEKKVTIQLRKPDINSELYYWTEWEFSLFRDERGKPFGIICIGYENNDLINTKYNLKRLLNLAEDNERINKLLNRTLKFQELISDLSSAFVKTTDDSFDEDINSMLYKIGTFFDADRSYLFLTPDNLETISNTHEWCSLGISPQKDHLQNMSMNDLPWFKSRIGSNPYIYIYDTNSLPSEARVEKRMLQNMEIRSLLFIAIKTPKKIYGAIGFDAVKKTFRWTEEQIQGLVVLANIIGDLLQKIQTEKELQATKKDFYEKIQDIFNNIDSATWSRDLNGNYLFVNNAALNLTGYTKQEWEATTELWKKIYPKKDWEYVARVFDETIREGQHQRQQTMITKKGEIKIVKIVHKVAYDADGQPIRIDSTSTDITEIINYQNRLELLNNELNAFTYSISHDLRAPLRSIEGFTQIIQEDYADKLDIAGKGYLKRIQYSSQKMSKLINDLLDLSRLSTRETNRQRVNLTKMAHSINKMLLEALPINGKDIVFKIQPDITATADPLMIELVLQNLFENALKYSMKKDKILIEFSSVKIKGETTYYIRDNGVGFNMKYYDKLFQPFQRLHSENEFDGSGIGLTIVKRILNKHGGDIWAESMHKTGSTFYFTLG